MSDRSQGKAWTVPTCAKGLTHLVQGDGGNDHEELLNRMVMPGTNDIVVAMQLQVRAQYALLERLHRAGYLRKAGKRGPTEDVEGGGVAEAAGAEEVGAEEAGKPGQAGQTREEWPCPWMMYWCVSQVLAMKPLEFDALRAEVDKQVEVGLVAGAKNVPAVLASLGLEMVRQCIFDIARKHGPATDEEWTEEDGARMKVAVRAELARREGQRKRAAHEGEVTDGG
jgi:hypothetical protein